MSRLPDQIGKVYLVGAGPGDPGLITLRAVECLRQADLVLYDYLVNPALLDHLGDGAEAICLGHHSAQRAMPQEEINARMIEAARAGRTVVRLKGGDPDVFAHSAEETGALVEAGIPLETVPGVTAALAAAGYAGIPITHAEHSSAIALVTGRERRSKRAAGLDYGAFADFPGTLIFYMGVKSAGNWSRALLDRGKPAQTPVAIVRRCTWNDQTVVRCTLSTVAETIRQRNLKPPAVIVVGDVVDLGPPVSWFAARPLFGRRVLVTRPRHQAERLCRELAQEGALVSVQPAIEITDPPDWGPVDGALDRLDRFDWLVFSSANGVRYLLGRLAERGADVRALGGLKLAAIGPGTAEELRAWHLKADLVPEAYRAEALAEALARKAAGQRFLLARASRGRDVLARQLTAAGNRVEEIVVYTSRDVSRADGGISDSLVRGEIDWITITSSAIARSLAHLFGESLRHARLASISPVTSQTLRTLGYEPAVEATDYTMAGIVEAMAGEEG